MKEVKVGMIGSGLLGETHAQFLSKIPGVRLYAFCDIMKEKAEVLCRKFNAGYATSDFYQVANDSDIDAVFLCTQHNTHAEYCIAALEKGKYVFIEKPMAMTLEECLAIAKALKKSEAKLMAGFKMRYYDAVLKAKELIPEPLVITMQMMDDKWAADFWANDPVRGGGNIISQGCHSCDLIRYLAGNDPVSVYAVGGNYYQPNKMTDNLCAVFRFQKKMTASWVQGDCKCPALISKFFLQMYGEDTCVTLDERLTRLTYQCTGEPDLILKYEESGFEKEDAAFIECILQGKEPEISARDGLYATLMALQAIRSAQSGKPEPVAELAEQSLQME